MSAEHRTEQAIVASTEQLSVIPAINKLSPAGFTQVGDWRSNPPPNQVIP